MTQIPVYMRDRLASSQVGVAPLDTSTAKIFEGVSQSAEAVGKASLSYDLQQKMYQNQAETNTLIAQYKMGASDTFEAHKNQFANNPEEAVKSYQVAMQQQQEDIIAQASNSRVKGMLSATLPKSSVLMAKHLDMWANGQRDKLNVDKIADLGNEQGKVAYMTAADTSMDYATKKFRLLTVLDASKNLAAAIDPSHPELNEKRATALQGMVFKNAFDGLVDANPAQANQFLKEKEVVKTIPGPDLMMMQKTATQAMLQFQKRQELNDVTGVMIKQPEMAEKVMNGEMSWGALERMDPTNSDAGVTALKKMSLNMVSPEGQMNQVELLQKLGNLHEQAHQLGLELRSGENAKDHPVTDSIEKLTDLQREVIHLMPFSKDAVLMNKKISSAMAMEVAKAHNPTFLENLQKGASWAGEKAFSFGQKDTVGWFDKFSGGYDEINNQINRQATAMNWTPEQTLEKKVRAYSLFLTDMDKVNGNTRNVDNTPMRAQDLVRELFNLKVGAPYPVVVNGVLRHYPIKRFDQTTGEPMLDVEGASLSATEQTVGIK